MFRIKINHKDGGSLEEYLNYKGGLVRIHLETLAQSGAVRGRSLCV